jgi:hypothetical protein
MGVHFHCCLVLAKLGPGKQGQAEVNRGRIQRIQTLIQFHSDGVVSILLVEGTLTLSGHPSYKGLILVIGKGVVTKNGGGNATVQYDSCWANALNASLPYSSIGVREMMY